MSIFLIEVKLTVSVPVYVVDDCEYGAEQKAIEIVESDMKGNRFFDSKHRALNAEILREEPE